MTIAAFDDNLAPPTMVAEIPLIRHHRSALGLLFAPYKSAAACRWQTPWTIAFLTTTTLVQAYCLFSFYAPANGGTDQNGYHVTARLLTEGRGASFVPTSPFAFVGSMMVMREDGRIYAKYPPGYPLFAAIARLVGGASAVYLVNPICTVLACTFSYFLFRTLLGKFASLLAVLWLSWNPLVLTYANDGNSHASTLLCIVIGAWGMISWLQHDSFWNAILGGCCLGYAATIRYSEILLLLPVLFAAATHFFLARPLKRDRAVESAGVVIAWAIPVAFLACFCWSAFGAPWKTGYAYCAEDSGFGWKYFIGDPALRRQGNWETLLVQLNWMGLLMLWPVGLAGMIALIGARWREGIFIALGVIPSMMLYLCYYWAPTGETSLSYLRFFVSVIPALILCAIWLIERGVICTRAGGAVAMGVMTAIGLSVNLWNTLPSLESSLAKRQALAQAAEFVHNRVPKGSSLFIADEGLSNCLDAAGGYTLYNLQLFKNSSFTSFNRIMDDQATAGEPDPRQRARIALYWHLMGAKNPTGDFIPKSNEQLKQAQDQLLGEIVHANAHVFLLLATGQNQDLLPDETKWRSHVVASDVCYPNVLIVSHPVGGWSAPNRNDGAGPHVLNPVTWTLYEIRPQHS